MLTVNVVDFVPEEHTLGLQTEPCNRYMAMAKFLEHWTKNEACYAVVARGDENRFEQQMQNQSFHLRYQDTFFSLYGNTAAK